MLGVGVGAELPASAVGGSAATVEAGVAISGCDEAVVSAAFGELEPPCGTMVEHDAPPALESEEDPCKASVSSSRTIVEHTASTAVSSVDMGSKTLSPAVELLEGLLPASPRFVSPSVHSAHASPKRVCVLRGLGPPGCVTATELWDDSMRAMASASAQMCT